MDEDRERIIRAAWEERGKAQWDTETHGRGLLSLHIPAKVEMRPVRFGAPKPPYDDLEFRLVRATMNGQPVNSIVCEGVVVETLNGNASQPISSAPVPPTDQPTFVPRPPDQPLPWVPDSQSWDAAAAQIAASRRGLSAAILSGETGPTVMRGDPPLTLRAQGDPPVNDQPPDPEAPPLDGAAAKGNAGNFAAPPPMGVEGKAGEEEPTAPAKPAEPPATAPTYPVVSDSGVPGPLPPVPQAPPTPATNLTATPNEPPAPVRLEAVGLASGAATVTGLGSNGVHFPDVEAVDEWLKGQSQEAAVVFAARAALRVVPTLSRSPDTVTRTTREMILRVFRAVATAWAVAAYPGFRTQLNEAARSALFGLGNLNAPPNIRAAVYASAAATGEAGVSARASTAVGYALDAARSKGREAFELFLQALATDAALLGQRFSPVTLANSQLWPRQVPDWVHEDWQQLKVRLLAANEQWEVWIDWYEARLLGAATNQIVDLARARMVEEVWRQGPDVVNAHLSLLIQNPEEFQLPTPPEREPPPVPKQSPAPVRVEERHGKIARASDRDSPLRSSESDFNAWREPIIDHVQELLAGDFRQGTNHARARDRLVALDHLLSGSVSEAKDRQFHIGYETERLEGLIAAYRSTGDDMPELNAAVLEDLDRLRISLKTGVDKLERWADFRQEAADDPLREGGANPTLVGQALDEMAVEMERQAKYFNPELPATFHYLAEAVKDPAGATRTVVYGAVKSAENLISFLGQKALGTATKAADAVEEHISKVVAGLLITVLGAYALQISEALPAGWAWLKPLLDAVAKMSGGG
jgi:hypothetical protein